MVPTESVINFRFKSGKESEKFTFSGTSVSVRQLKVYINEKHKLDQKSSRPDKSQAPSELVLVNHDTKDVYTSDDAEIPQNATIVVTRQLVGGEKAEAPESPLALQQQDNSPPPAKPDVKDSKPDSPKFIPEKSNSVSEPFSYGYSYNSYDPNLQGKDDPAFTELKFSTRIKEGTDISELDDLTEDQKILAMMYQALLFYDHTQFHRAPANRNQGPPPPSYTCNRCGLAGHWTRSCNSNIDYNIRRTITRAPVVLPTNATVNPAPYATVPVEGQEYEDVPLELRCRLCQGILRDPVMLPCCNVCFCDTCVRDALIGEYDSTCPSCKSPASPDSCMPNMYLRGLVEKWEREMQIKRKKKEDSTAGKLALSVKIPPGKEPTTPPMASGGPQVIRPSSRPFQRPEAPIQRILTSEAGENKGSSEPRTISSLVSSGVSKISAAMLQQQVQPDGIRRGNSGGISGNTGFMANAPSVRPVRQPFPSGNMAAAAGFFGQYGADFATAAYMTQRYGAPMDQAMIRARLAYTASMARYGATFLPSQADMYGTAMRFAAPGPGILPPGQSLRVTRIPNQPKVPVQSPYDSERRSPERSRDDYRRDKEEDRRRDVKSDDRKYDKYDERKDRRLDDRKRDDRDDRRTPERRRSRDSDRRSRAESPDRRKRESRHERSSPDHRPERDLKKDRKKDELSPSGKVKSERSERRAGSWSKIKSEPDEVKVEKSVPDNAEGGPPKIISIKKEQPLELESPDVEVTSRPEVVIKPEIKASVVEPIVAREPSSTDKIEPLHVIREEKVPVTPPAPAERAPKKIPVELKKMIAAHVREKPKHPSKEDKDKEKLKQKDREKEKEKQLIRKPRSERTPILPPSASPKVLMTAPADDDETEFPLSVHQQQSTSDSEKKSRKTSRSTSKKDKRSRDKRPRSESDDRKSTKKRPSLRMDEGQEGRPVGGDNSSDKELVAVKSENAENEPKDKKRPHKSSKSKRNKDESSSSRLARDKRPRSESGNRKEAKRKLENGDDLEIGTKARDKRGGFEDRDKSHRSSKSKKGSKSKSKSTKEKKPAGDSKSFKNKDSTIFDARPVIEDLGTSEKEVEPTKEREKSSEELKGELKRSHKSRSKHDKDKSKSSRRSTDRKKKRKKHRRDRKNGIDSRNSNSDDRPDDAVVASVPASPVAE